MNYPIVFKEPNVIKFGELLIYMNAETQQYLQSRGAWVEQGGRPKPELVKEALANPEPLLLLEDFGLTPDPVLTKLARRMPNKYLDSGNILSEHEREQRFRRIYFLPLVEIREHPDSFFMYQAQGVRQVAEMLHIPPNKDIPVPLPAGIHPKYVRSFREEEKQIKNLSDWHYFLLYPDVWKVFFECVLPYCALPPYRLLKQTGERGALRDVQAVFVRSRQVNSFEIINKARFLNYYHAGELRLNVPGRVLKTIIEASGTPGIIHGLARTLYTGEGEDLIEQEDYMTSTPDQVRRIPKFDIDTFILGDVDFELITRRIKQMRDIQVDTGVAEGLSMAGTYYGWVSKPQYTKHPIPDDPRTFMTMIRAWMGRAVRQPTDSLALSLLTVPVFRSYCLWPDLKNIQGTQLFALKPEDIYGGLIHQLRGSIIEGTKRVIIDSYSWEDMIPDNEPMAYWMLFRLFSDIVWQKGILPWEKMRTMVNRLFVVWSDVKQNLRPDRAQLQLADLHRIAEKALIKAISDDPWTTMILMTERDSGKGYFGIGMSKFYPNIENIYRNASLWSIFLERLRNKPIGIDGMEHITDVIKGLPELRAIIQNGQKEISGETIRTWLVKTIIV